MTRSEARALLDRYVHTDWLKKHSIASAAVLETLAERLGEDGALWWAAGLLHDVDFDETQDPHVHGRRGAEILRAHGVEEPILQAVQAHNAEGLGLERVSRLDWAITCGESVTGLVVATALVMPDKKLASVEGEGVVKRMKKKDFARKVSRERIQLCERIGLPLDEFIGLAVQAMKRVAVEIGL